MAMGCVTTLKIGLGSQYGFTKLLVSLRPTNPQKKTFLSPQNIKFDYFRKKAACFETPILCTLPKFLDF